jgi:CRP-like cAMP-binding protein
VGGVTPSGPAPLDGTTVVERVLALRSFDAFSDVGREDLAALAWNVRPRRFGPGEALQAAGEPARVHCILRGEAEERRSKGRVRRRTAHELATALDALAGGAPRVTVVAAAPTQTLEIERPGLLELLEEQFDLLVAFMRVAALEYGRLDRPDVLAPAIDASAPDRGAPLTLAERIVFLRRLALFRRVHSRSLGEMALEMDEQRLRAGESLWLAGEPAGWMVIVVRGRVQCAAGAGLPGVVLAPGSVLGLADCLGRRLRRRDVTASTDVSVLRLGCGALLDLLEDDPEMTVATLVRLARHAVRGA